MELAFFWKEQSKSIFEKNNFIEASGKEGQCCKIQKAGKELF